MTITHWHSSNHRMFVIKTKLSLVPKFLYSSTYKHAFRCTSEPGNSKAYYQNLDLYYTILRFQVVILQDASFPLNCIFVTLTSCARTALQNFCNLLLLLPQKGNPTWTVPGSVLGQSMLDLGWTKWQEDGIYLSN